MGPVATASQNVVMTVNYMLTIADHDLNSGSALHPPSDLDKPCVNVGYF